MAPSGKDRQWHLVKDKRGKMSFVVQKPTSKDINNYGPKGSLHFGAPIKDQISMEGAALVKAIKGVDYYQTGSGVTDPDRMRELGSYQQKVAVHQKNIAHLMANYHPRIGEQFAVDENGRPMFLPVFAQQNGDAPLVVYQPPVAAQQQAPGAVHVAPPPLPQQPQYEYLDLNETYQGSGWQAPQVVTQQLPPLEWNAATNAWYLPQPLPPQHLPPQQAYGAQQGAPPSTYGGNPPQQQPAGPQYPHVGAPAGGVYAQPGAPPSQYTPQQQLPQPQLYLWGRQIHAQPPAGGYSQPQQPYQPGTAQPAHNPAAAQQGYQAQPTGSGYPGYQAQPTGSGYQGYQAQPTGSGYPGYQAQPTGSGYAPQQAYQPQPTGSGYPPPSQYGAPPSQYGVPPSQYGAQQNAYPPQQNAAAYPPPTQPAYGVPPPPPPPPGYPQF